ncbi:DUF2809 domain-containing protein [Sphingomonas canadensis]|uniref:DUF2809 domain-containing protein n=1 Tax=Sphingomonas canadensis TaxID=1219257 RepID=A0ABW3HGW5_9SPHN|nr:DUF2809 domain-containing protein [Sphingomonas canadensis]MCW3838276.1 DUF2809 domain-containing protein [Sphingomonas canadensis]
MRPPPLRPGYALAAAAIFAVEVLIALFVRDRFVRPYLGDVLAVVLVYAGLRAITPLRVVPAALAALGVAFAVELGQLAGLVHLLGLGSSPVARTVLGTGFDPADLLAYTAGAGIVVVAEHLRGVTAREGSRAAP